MGERMNARLAAAMAGGYVLGRSKKGGAALTTAAVLLSRGVKPRDLVTEGIRTLAGGTDDAHGSDGPEGGGPKSPGGDKGPDKEHGGVIRHAAVRTARAAAVSTLNTSVTALAHALHERTAAMTDESGPDESGTDKADTDEGAADKADTDKADTTEDAGRTNAKRKR